MNVNLAYVKDIKDCGDKYAEAVNDIKRIQRDIPDGVIVNIDLSYGYTVTNVTNSNTNWNHIEFVGPNDIDVKHADIVVIDSSIVGHDQEVDILELEKTGIKVIYEDSIKKTLMDYKKVKLYFYGPLLF